MPQMMPIYWFFICMLVNLFVHFFFSFYYHNFLFFVGSLDEKEKKFSQVNFLK